MFLKKVEIQGFKSFASKTTLEFLPACVFQSPSGKADEADGNGKKSCGITAIVGPNGSGKSNVADAIRWAMGEQSMKTLRGKKSEDIIFTGSGKKARLGSAQVVLHFDNSDKRIPLEFSEVAIARRVFRDGEAEYFINGSRMRLLDVTDLLARAGIGKESYCVINQGMSDAALSATPAERRVILEDAAGVKQYQIKKERSLRKLESTEENLKRVGELIREIEPHLKILRRQAEKARRGKEVGAELRTKQMKLFSFLWRSFQAERGNLLEEKNEMGAKMMNVQREIDKINDELKRESKTDSRPDVLEKLERERQTLNEQLNSLEKELVVTEGKLEIENERSARWEKSKSVPVDREYVREKIKNIRDRQADLIERIRQAESPGDLQEIREFAQAIQQELYELFEDTGKESVEIKREVSGEQDETLKIIGQLEDKTGEIRQKIEKIKEEAEKQKRIIEEEIVRQKKSRERFFELERGLRDRQTDLDKMKDRFNESKIRLARVEVREEDLTAEISNELRMKPEELVYGGEEVDRESLEKEIGRLKVQLEQIGGIDPLIDQEYGETQKRFDFLTKESDDLSRAISSLQKVVREMDEKINQEFNDAFEQVNREFTRYFRIIFGGGNAHLMKSKIKNKKPKKEAEENENESSAEGDGLSEDEEGRQQEEGVDIFACPPGKKITHLSMLSGGERSLTSIALLFAIISHNPPPFAVLDEVEAALDEANSRRFGRILQALSGNTQFIVITHNRETMRQASLLYGVTMSSDGISKLLSVRLDQIGQEGNIKK